MATAKNNTSNGEYDNMCEFNNDIRVLMQRPDMQCREDICKSEFDKAQSLLENITAEKAQRCYDLMGNLASQFEYVPAIMWMGWHAEFVMQNMEQATFWYKKAADLGDGEGARCYADMLMSGNGVPQDFQLAIQYYAKAADKGIPEAAFVLGEYFRNTGDLGSAVKAYLQAYDGGYAPAKTRLDQMKKKQ